MFQSSAELNKRLAENIILFFFFFEEVYNNVLFQKYKYTYAYLSTIFNVSL